MSLLIYWLWRLGLWLARSLPIAVTYPVAAGLADVGWMALPNKRRNTIENMLHVTDGDAGRARRLARRSFENYAIYIVDFMRQPSLNDAYLVGRVGMLYWQQLDAILAQGKGCILVLMHFGNWDYGAAAVALRGYPFNAIAEAQGTGRLNAEIFAARSKRGMRLIPMERAATGIIRAMRRGELLAILIDRPLTAGGVEVEFFGARTRVPEGPARIALRTGAKVVPVSVLRISRRDDRMRAVADLSIEHPATGDREADVQILTQAILASQEGIIRRHPDQWYMFRQMWPNASADADDT
ncbi:MAG: lysophospholipid acyltransferase family protein [Dehalococcoidia bacterium]